MESPLSGDYSYSFLLASNGATGTARESMAVKTRVKRVHLEASLGKPEEKKWLGTTGMDNTIKICLKKKGFEVVDWIRLAWYGVQS